MRGGPKITADFYVAYHSKKPPEEIEKSAFLVVRNGTGEDVAIGTFVFEDKFWRRWSMKGIAQQLVVETKIMDVPAQNQAQMTFLYHPKNPIFSQNKYFGIKLTNRKIVWIRRRRWRMVQQEFMSDFPDWTGNEMLLRRAKIKTYGESRSLESLDSISEPD